MFRGDLHHEDGVIWEYPVFYYYSEFEAVSHEKIEYFKIKTFLKSANDVSKTKINGKQVPPADNEEPLIHPRKNRKNKRYTYYVFYSEFGLVAIEVDMIEWLLSLENKWDENSDVPNSLGICTGLIGEKCKNPYINYKVVKQELLSNLGRIHFKNLGNGIKIFVDGKRQNRKSILIKGKDRVLKYLTPGKHEIILKKNGYKPWKKNIKVIGQKRHIYNPLFIKE